MEMQYSLQLETDANIDRKRAGAPKRKTAVENKHLIIERKRNRKKNAPVLTTELNSSQQQLVLFSSVKTRFRSARRRRCIAIKIPLLRNLNKQKRRLWAEKL